MHDEDGKLIGNKKYIVNDVDPSLRVKKYSDSQHFEASVVNGSRTAKYLNNDPSKENSEDDDANSVLSSDERMNANKIEI